ncbi:MAG: Rubredoxin [Candidatus Jettenia ecosi]|uniref:Rubredoxin n=1 Tax=Candidatus Jettenia ecosi TaxID=2494326 RepID=A0A533QDQ0_9BACT|nr:MAG: Rubredoxin [Candidatus Jettenia ecosi]
MGRYKCVICGYIYDPNFCDPDHGINPGISFQNLPEDWGLSSMWRPKGTV